MYLFGENHGVVFTLAVRIVLGEGIAQLDILGQLGGNIGIEFSSISRSKPRSISDISVLSDGGPSPPLPGIAAVFILFNSEANTDSGHAHISNIADNMRARRRLLKSFFSLFFLSDQFNDFSAFFFDLKFCFLLCKKLHA